LINPKHNLVNQFYKEFNHYLNKLIILKKLQQNSTLIILYLDNDVIRYHDFSSLKFGLLFKYYSQYLLKSFFFFFLLFLF